MKKARWFIPLVLLAACGCAAYLSSSDAGYGVGSGGAYIGGPQESGAELDINTCYDYLSPFGNWVNLDAYGYVWCPRHMGYRWRPYSDGHWVWTDYGWTWISDFDWGWMPFHYGRWGWDDDCGWFWAPGTVWGPAWVTWRSSDLYMGWAPIPPGIEFRAGMDFDDMSRRIHGDAWVFVGGSHFLDRDIHRSVLPYERNTTIVNSTVIRNNYSFRENRLVNGGIDIDTVRRTTGRDVVRYRLADSNRPGEAQVAGREVRFYRPSIRGNAGARPKAYLDREQARRELAPARIFESPRQAPAAAPESEVRKRQADERTLLEKSQARERQNMERRRDEDGKTSQGPAEKARVQQDYQNRISQMQKQHQAEKEQLSQRHKQDSEEVRQSAQARQQQAPPERKKK